MTTTLPRHEAAATDAAAISALQTSLRDELQTQRAELVELEAIVRDLTGQLDVASVLERESSELALTRCIDVIADIEHALERIADATFGTCERCDDAMSLERLEAIPYARHCLSCVPAAPRAIRD